MRSPSWVVVGVFAAALCSAACVSPTVRSSAPLVFTMEQVRDARAEFAERLKLNDDVQVVQHELDRLMRAYTSREPDRLFLDQMLLNDQGYFGSASTRYLHAALQVATLEKTAPAAPKHPAEFAAAWPAQSPVNDSPTDFLDRANEYYLAYFFKMLRPGQDARLSAPPSTEPTPPIPTRPRLLMLMFDVSVTPGTEADVMAGVRWTVWGGSKGDLPPYDDPDLWGNDHQAMVPSAWHRSAHRIREFRTRLAESGNPAECQILRAHPRRMYDFVRQDFRERNSAYVAAEPAAAATPAGPAARAGSDTDRLQRLPLRVTKVGGFVDSATNTFGWDFYPSNARRDPWRGLVAESMNFFFGQPANVPKYYLEGGARECVVYLMVPSDWKWIVLQRRSFRATVAVDAFGAVVWDPEGIDERSASIPPGARAFQDLDFVRLPPVSRGEFGPVSDSANSR